MKDIETQKLVNGWKNQLLKIQKKGRASVYNPKDLSNGLYAWLDMKDVIDAMERFVIH